MINRRIFKASLIILLLVAFTSLYENLTYKEISLNGGQLKAQIAATDYQRKKGLSSRKEIAEKEGMIFTFEEEDFHSIWMKDMNFSIDIIWINSEKEIVDIKRNASPDSYPETFRPNKPAKYVLEVKAGFVEKNNLKIGDTLDFDL
ncbi:MAG: DUF192 domain-containing protein [Patescibacteria group bacterium]